MQKGPWAIMTEMNPTNAVGGAGETANPLGELEEAQIICVIGKISLLSLWFSHFVTRCLRRASRRARCRQRHAMHKIGQRSRRCASFSRRPSQRCVLFGAYSSYLVANWGATPHMLGAESSITPPRLCFYFLKCLRLCLLSRFVTQN